MIFAFDGFELDADRLQLRRGGKVVKVDSPVVRLLTALVRNAGKLVSKEELVEEVWEGRAVADNVITVAMARLRKALMVGRGRGDFVATSYGRGYRFVRPVTVRTESAAEVSQIKEAPAALPFVGRERVLGRLREALRDARGGRGRLCVLMGEAGIGKTRVVEMFERELSGTPVRVAWGYCQQGGETPPLFPWRQLLNEIAGSSEAESLLQTGNSLESTERFHFTDAPLKSDSKTAGASAGTEAARHRAFDLILRSFMRVGNDTPWLLVLDDLHRADPASLELLSHLVDRIGRVPMLVVATLRFTDAGLSQRGDSPLPRILGHRNCERIKLDRLEARDVSDYVHAFLEDPEGKLARAVYEKSEGNPFFMTELSRQLRNSENPRAEELAVADAALDLVRQRVSKVDARARGLLSVCAVIGRRFELGLLADVTTRDAATLMEDLDTALRAEVLCPVANSRTVFDFSHELIRAVLYDGLSAAERRRHHLRVAETLELRLTAGESIPPAELAYHFHAALPSGDLHKTVHYCRAAAQAAVPVFAYTDVARYTRNALEALLLMERPSIRLRMSLLYFTAIYVRPHDSLAHMQCLDELLRLGREHEHGEMLVRVSAMLNAHPGLPLLRPMRAAVEQGLALLPEERLGLHAVGKASLAHAAPYCYDAARCEPLVDDAVAMAHEANSCAAMYLTLLAQLHLMGGPLHEVRADAIAARLELLAQHNPVELAALPIDLAFYRATRALSSGDLASATAALERAAAHSRQLRHSELLWHAERLLALVRISAGETERGREELEALHVRAKRQCLFGTEVFCGYDRAVVLAGSSAVDSPRDDALRSALQYHSEDAPAIWAMKVRASAAAGLTDEARAALRTILPEQLAALPCDAQYLGTLGHLVHAALRLKEVAYYEPLAQLLARYPQHYAAHVFALCDGAVEGLLARLQHAMGEKAKASERLERALQLNETAGFVACAAEMRVLMTRAPQASSTRQTAKPSRHSGAPRL